MILEQLLEDYNRESETVEHYAYNDLGDFSIWLGHKGYRLNNCRPLDFAIANGGGRADDFINNNNIILTHVKHETELIQFMQDKGMTFTEMMHLTLRMQDKLNSLIKKQS